MRYVFVSSSPNLIRVAEVAPWMTNEYLVQLKWLSMTIAVSVSEPFPIVPPPSIEIGNAGFAESFFPEAEA